MSASFQAVGTRLELFVDGEHRYTVHTTANHAEAFAAEANEALRVAEKRAEDAEERERSTYQRLAGCDMALDATEGLLADAVRERDEALAKWEGHDCDKCARAELELIEADEALAASQALVRRYELALKQIALGNPAWKAGSEAISLARAALAEAPQAAPQAGPWRCCWCHKVLPNQSVGPDYEFCPFCRGTFSFGKPTQAAPASQPADRQEGSCYEPGETRECNCGARRYSISANEYYVTHEPGCAQVAPEPEADLDRATAQAEERLQAIKAKRGASPSSPEPAAPRPPEALLDAVDLLERAIKLVRSTLRAEASS